MVDGIEGFVIKKITETEEGAWYFAEYINIVTVNSSNHGAYPVSDVRL